MFPNGKLGGSRGRADGSERPGRGSADSAARGRSGWGRWLLRSCHLDPRCHPQPCSLVLHGVIDPRSSVIFLTGLAFEFAESERHRRRRSGPFLWLCSRLRELTGAHGGWGGVCARRAAARGKKPLTAPASEDRGSASPVVLIPQLSSVSGRGLPGRGHSQPLPACPSGGLSKAGCQTKSFRCWPWAGPGARRDDRCQGDTCGAPTMHVITFSLLHVQKHFIFFKTQRSV